MKKFLPLFFVLFAFSGCSNNTVTVDNENGKNKPAYLIENLSEVYILRVDGRKYKRGLLNTPYAEYLPPGKHKFTVKYNWTSSIPLVVPGVPTGVASIYTQETSPIIKSVCINMKPGHRYYMSATPMKNKKWDIIIRESATRWGDGNQIKSIYC